MTFAIDDGIASGNFNAADICFLVAIILFAIAAFLLYPRPTTPPIGHSVLALGAAAVALGLMLLVIADGIYVGGGVILLILIVILIVLFLRR